MKEILLQLKNLQEIDNLLLTLSRTRHNNQEQQENLQKNLDTSQEQLTKSQQQLKNFKNKHRELEAEVTDLDSKRQVTEQRKQMAANNAEMEALQRQHQSLSTRLDEVENQTLDLLDLMENEEEKLILLTQTITQEQTTTQKHIKQLAQENLNDLQELTQLNNKKETLCQTLPPDWLNKYQEISQNRAGRAVAEAIAGMCQVCRLSLPHQLLNELQIQEKILHCPHCTRILYWNNEPN